MEMYVLEFLKNPPFCSFVSNKMAEATMQTLMQTDEALVVRIEINLYTSSE